MKEFDFKRTQRDLVTRELGPILYEQGFVLSRPVTYTRERRGLMQQFYFRGEAWGETYKLRPWISYRPVYDARPVLCFGTDGIYVNDCLNPYTGFSPIYWDISRADFQNRFFPGLKR